MNVPYRRAMGFAVLIWLFSGTAALCQADTTVGAGDGQYSSASGLVRGSVTAPDGSPVVGAFLQPTSLDRPPALVPEIAILTDDQGVYEWTLTPGEYEFSVLAEGHQFPAQRVVVRPDETAILNFTAIP